MLLLAAHGSLAQQLRQRHLGTTVVDNFSSASPFDPSTGDPYFYFAAGDYVGDDADIVQGPNSITQTAVPFTRTFPQDPNGGLDHVKSLQYRTQRFVPGIIGKVEYELQISATVTLPEVLPFESALVSNPDDDIRLAASSMNVLDLETFIVADFFLTNSGIWVLNERLPFGWTKPADYAAYTQVKRVGDRSPGDIHNLKITYDKVAGEIQWFLEDNMVLSTNTLGTPIPEENGILTIIDHGGPNEIVSPSGIFCGWGQFTLLDAIDPNNPGQTEGLVKLSDTKNFYIVPEKFSDKKSDEANRLYEQGATSTIYKFRVKES